jgi:hypothetical protein
MNTITVKNQEELDELPVGTTQVVRIISDSLIYINDNMKSAFVEIHNSNVVITDHSCNNTVVATGKSRLTIGAKILLQAYNSCVIKSIRDGTVWCYNECSVEAYMRTYVKANGSCSITAFDASIVEAGGSIFDTVVVRHTSRVNISGCRNNTKTVLLS